MPILSSIEARRWIPTLTGTGEDTVLEEIIGAVDSAICAYLGWPMPSTGDRSLLVSTYVVTVDGPAGVELWLPIRPVISVTSIYDSTDRSFGTTDLVASTDYTLTGRDGLVELDHDSVHGVWSRARRSVRVTLTAGWAEASDIPAPIRTAAGRWVAHLYRLRHEGGMASLSQGGASVSMVDPTIPDEVAELLAPHRLMGGLVG